MRKSLLMMLVAILMPLLAAADNMAISKNIRTAIGTLTEDRLIIDHSVLIPAGTTTDTKAESYSLGAWVNIPTLLNQTANNSYSDEGNQLIFGYGATAHCNTNGLWGLVLGADGQLKLKGHHIYLQDGDNALVSTGSSLPLGEWAHLMVVYDSSAPSLTVYLNGEALQSFPLTQKLDWWITSDDLCAIVYAAYGFGGQLDEAQLYSKALSSADVKVAYNNAAMVDGLAALYTFDEVSGTNEFPNMSTQTGASSVAAKWMRARTSSTNYAWSNGLAYTSNTATEPTLVAGRAAILGSETTLTIANGEGGLLSVTDGENVYSADGQYTVTTGTELTISATPAEGYSLKAIFAENELEKVEVVNGSVYMVTGATTISAEYTTDFYPLTINAPAGVTYSVKRNGVEVDDLTKLNAATTYQFSISAVPYGMRVSSVTLNGAPLSPASGLYSFEIQAVSTIEVTLEELPKYNVAITNVEGGTITASYASATGTSVITGSAQVVEGTVLTLSNTPADGYAFAGYLVNGATYGASTLAVDADKTISGIFDLASEVDPDYCTPAATAMTYEYFHPGRFVWQLHLQNAEDPADVIDILTQCTDTITDSSSNRKAKYGDYTDREFIAKAGETLKFWINGKDSHMRQYLFIDYNRNGVFDQTATNAVGGELVAGFFTSSANTVRRVFDDFILPSDLTPGRYRVRYMMSQDDPAGCTFDKAAIVCDFTIRIISDELENPRTVTVATANDACGSVAITAPATTDTSIETNASTVTITATPAQGYGFISWTDAAGNVVSTDPVYVYKGTTDASFTANFGAVLTFSASDNGSVAVTANGSTVNSGDVVELGAEIVVTATPDVNYQLAQLSVNGATVEENPYTFTISEPTVITATFADVTYSLSINVSGNGQVVVSDMPMASMTEIDVNMGAVEFFNGSPIVAGEYYYIHFIPAAEETLVSARIEGCDDGEGNNFIEYPEQGDPIWFSVAGPDDGYYLEFEGADRMIIGANVATGDLTVTAVFSGASTAIDGIEADDQNAPVEYFNLQGIRVAAENLAPGIYLRRQGSKVQKVLIKK